MERKRKRNYTPKPRKYITEIIYDDGRLIIRRCGIRKYMGLRTDSISKGTDNWEFIIGRQTGFIKGVHDMREVTERKAKARVIIGEYGREFASEAAKKRKREHHVLAKQFMTSRSWEAKETSDDMPQNGIPASNRQGPPERGRDDRQYVSSERDAPHALSFYLQSAEG